MALLLRSMRPLSTRSHILLPRYSSTSTTAPAAPSHLNDEERSIYSMLAEKLQPSALEVADVSGGCGSMYAISVTSEAFRGLSVLKQQRLVNAALGEKIKGWHGVQMRCSVPK